MKFLADVGISTGAVAFLCEWGHDAIHLFEQDLHRLSDTDIIAKAHQEKRIILTHDLDFGDLMAASGNRLPSIIIFRLPDMRPPNVILHLQMILNPHQAILESRALLSVTQNRIRVRVLPL